MNYQEQYNMEQQQNKPDGALYVFSSEPVEDRAKSMSEGRLVLRDRDVCTVYRAGDQQSAVKWVIEELPPEKMLRIKRQYDAWKAGQEEPVNGTSLRMWPAISKAQAENLWALNVRTVEDLASVSDNNLPNLGMGSRALRDKATAWLQSAGNIGKVSEQLAALNARLLALEESNSEKDAALAEKDKLILELSEKAGEPVKRGPGRPPKTRQEDEAA
jgi:hypothetical protein